MQRERPLKHFLIAFAIAVLCYVVAYSTIEHRRNRKGPWQVSFIRNPEGSPELVIHQPRVAVTNVRIAFIDRQAPAQPDTTLRFDQPKKVPYPLPFGKCIFMDTTFLPGTVTFEMFGHEIELLPRALIIDHQAHAWTANQTFSLSGATNTPANPGGQ